MEYRNRHCNEDWWLLKLEEPVQQALLKVYGEAYYLTRPQVVQFARPLTVSAFENSYATFEAERTSDDKATEPPEPFEPGNAPRITKLLALAIRFNEKLRDDGYSIRPAQVLLGGG